MEGGGWLQPAIFLVGCVEIGGWFSFLVGCVEVGGWFSFLVGCVEVGGWFSLQPAILLAGCPAQPNV